MDANDDGFVTREEAKDCPMLSAQFDVDGNGKIERDELHHFRMRKKDCAAQPE